MRFIKYSVLSLFFNSMILVVTFAIQICPDCKILFLDDFSGGLNTKYTQNKVPINQSPNMNNVLIDEKIGSLIKRNGYIVSGSTNSLFKVNFFFVYNKNDGSKEYLISDSSQVLSTKDFNTFTLIKSTLTTTGNLEAAQGRGKVWFVNGNDAPFTWNGTTMTILDGTNNTPYVPAGKFITYYQERFFVFNTTSNSSALNWSELTSTDANIIAPDDSRAWPTGNQLNIGGQDGQSGTGIIADRNSLYLHKNNSIWTLFGTDTLSYFSRKTNAQVGTLSNDSIVILDNLQYFLGKDGIYSFDGRESNRISDLISPDIQDVINNQSKIVSKTWQVKSDWERGSFYNSTTNASGFLTESDTFTLNDGIGGTTGGDVAINSNSTFSWTLIALNSNIPTNADWYLKAVSFRITSDDNGVPCNVNYDPSLIRLTYKNERTGISGTSNNGHCIGISPVQTARTFVRYDINLEKDSDRVIFTTSDYVSGNITFSLFNGNSINLTVSSHATGGGEQVILIQSSTGSFISEISTVTGTINFWDKFNSDRNTNGGTVNYFIRLATSSVNITTYPYTQISPGAVINSGSSNNYFQWSSSMIRANVNSNPTVDFIPGSPIISKVVVSNNQGAGSDTRAIATNWKNRYWLVVSTVTDGSVSLVYVKSLITNSNPNAWMRFSGLNIKALYNDGSDTLYAGSSSSGSVLRLDYGTNDNGLAIDAYYDTPELNLGDKYFEDWIREVFFDVDTQSSSNLLLGLSIDNKPFNFETISLDGINTRLLSSIKDSIINGFGKSFKFRFENNQLDKGLNFNTLGILYQEKETH